MTHEASHNSPALMQEWGELPACTAPHEAVWSAIIRNIAPETTRFASLIEHIPGVYNSHEGITRLLPRWYCSGGGKRPPCKGATPSRRPLRGDKVKRRMVKGRSITEKRTAFRRSSLGSSRLRALINFFMR